jgi:nicotinate dehydrogenase subunit B
MKANRQTGPESLAPEQYELSTPLEYTFQMNRRAFLQSLGTGLAVTFTFGNALGDTLSADLKDAEDQLSAWIHVGADSTVTVFTGKAEVGQNIRTSLAQIVAEELEVGVDKIVMVMGDTSLTPYDRGTFGSRSIPYMGPQLRKVAATAREHLTELAATRWKTDRSSVRIENGIATNLKSKEKINIGQLTEGKKLLKAIDDKVALKPVSAWKIAGTSAKKINGKDFVTGKHKYVSDIMLPGMLYGKVLRAPAYGATLASVDISSTKDMKDVVVVQDGNFIGVAAPSLAVANEALASIKADWTMTPQASREEIFKLLKDKSEKGSDEGSSGSVDESYSKADQKIERTFTVDYIAHAPLEPRAGVAQWTDGKLTVWTGTQRPFGVQEELEELFHIPKENIRVIQPDTGSGYGGKHTGEAGIEAARLARDAKKPVKVVWTREEEFTWAYFRPAGVIEVKAGISSDGKLRSWEFHNYNSGGSGIATPYAVADKKIQFHRSDSPLRQGSYRGLAATANVFARECIMNDLAVQAKIDPLAFRLQNLENERMAGVLKAAAEKFGWGKPVAPGHGVGLACGDEKGSYIATCAEVAIDPDPETDGVKVIRVVAAFECGAIINPNHLENQIQGSVIQGMGGALFEWIDFKNGKIINPAFSTYRVPRFSDCPKLEVVMLNRTDIPSVGAGETPILGIAPAIRNAIDNASGKKLYSLPLVPHGFQADKE